MFAPNSAFGKHVGPEAVPAPAATFILRNDSWTTNRVRHWEIAKFVAKLPRAVVHERLLRYALTYPALCERQQSSVAFAVTQCLNSFSSILSRKVRTRGSASMEVGSNEMLFYDQYHNHRIGNRRHMDGFRGGSAFAPRLLAILTIAGTWM